MNMLMEFFLTNAIKSFSLFLFTFLYPPSSRRFFQQDRVCVVCEILYEKILIARTMQEYYVENIFFYLSYGTLTIFSTIFSTGTSTLNG